MTCRNSFVKISIVVVVLILAQDSAALTIRSWDDDNQDGGDLNGAGTGGMGYSTLEMALLESGHTILPGISTLTAESLAGVDVFFHGASTHVLTSAEQGALVDFVAVGGALLVEADARLEARESANSALEPLILGIAFDGATGGSPSTTAGQFTSGSTRTTVGPFGDLRRLRFGSSEVADLDWWNIPNTSLIGGLGALESIVEYLPSTGGAVVLACGAPYGANQFVREDEALYNQNNLIAYLNYMSPGGVPNEQESLGSVKALYR